METMLPLRGKNTVKYSGQLYSEEYLLKGKDFWSLYDLSVDQILFDSDNTIKIVTTYFPVAVLKIYV